MLQRSLPGYFGNVVCLTSDVSIFYEYMQTDNMIDVA